MSRGDKFFAELETWLGTPFHPYASTKGAGADCKGLMAGAARELGFPEADSLYGLSLDYSLGRKDGIPADLLVEGMGKLFRRVKKMKKGDLLLCLHDGRPGHLACFDGSDAAIHAQISSKAHVKLTKLRALFHYYPLHSVWRWK